MIADNERGLLAVAEAAVQLQEAYDRGLLTQPPPIDPVKCQKALDHAEPIDPPLSKDEVGFGIEVIAEHARELERA